jgi:Zn finger protein HypA/HybF involved in hydrogenase expression
VIESGTFFWAVCDKCGTDDNEVMDGEGAFLSRTAVQAEDDVVSAARDVQYRWARAKGGDLLCPDCAKDAPKVDPLGVPGPGQMDLGVVIP